MRVLITGATGFIGGHTAARALRAGHDVRALVRSPDRLAHTMAWFDLPTPDHVIGDMTDPTAVDAAIAGVDAVIHCAAIVALGPTTGADREMIATNEAGTRTVLGRAVDHGCDPVVHVSSTSALFEPGSGPLTVDHPPATVDFFYAQAKADCETVARDLQREGSPVTIVYPSGVIGPPAGDAFGEAGLGIAGFVAGGVIPTRKAAVSLIDVRDLGSTLVALLESGRGPRRVMCGGHLLDMNRLTELYRDLTGRRFPNPPVPPAALRGLGRLFDALRRIAPVPTALTEEGMTVLTRWEGTIDSDLAALGVELRAPEATLADSLRAWHAGGLLTDRQAGLARSS